MYEVLPHTPTCILDWAEVSWYYEVDGTRTSETYQSREVIGDGDDFTIARHQDQV